MSLLDAQADALARGRDELADDIDVEAPRKAADCDLRPAHRAMPADEGHHAGERRGIGPIELQVLRPH